MTDPIDRYASELGISRDEFLATCALFFVSRGWDPKAAVQRFSDRLDITRGEMLASVAAHFDTKGWDTNPVREGQVHDAITNMTRAL